MNPSWVFLIVTILFVAVAMALVLRPLLRRSQPAARAGRRSINIAVYRDQLKEMAADRENGLLDDTQFEAAKLELEARLAQDAVEASEVQPVGRRARWLGAGLAVMIPLLAFGLYFAFGNPQALQGAGAATGMPSEHDIQAMLQSAEEKVKSEPDDAQTWVMLARAYSALERWPDAARALENLARLSPDDASVWSHYGEAIALANGRNLEGKPIELIRKALQLDPKDTKALELSGVYAFQHKDYKAAATYWQQVVDLSPPGEQYTQEMQGAVEKAREMAGEKAAPAGKLEDLSNYGGGNAAAAGQTVSGTLSVAPALKDKVGAGDTVFIFARDSQTGGGMPLAALRLQAGALPAQFELDDSMAMSPGNGLSGHQSVTLTARISKTGNAMPQPGDLEGELKAVKVGSKGLRLVVDRARPARAD